ncbi:MAG: phosphoribosyl-AMP cyclohydrolase [Cyanobacteria bacterium P01_F01_bin.33]
MSASFAQRQSIKQVEESTDLAPKFDAQGLIPVITTDASSDEVLMQGFMNAEALERTIATREAHYYSRSRKVLWHKGATSGLVQHVRQLLIDDDQDCLWMKVDVAGSGASCHVGYRSCFYREIPLGEAVTPSVSLSFTEQDKTFDPLQVYGDAPNPTQL